MQPKEPFVPPAITPDNAPDIQSAFPAMPPIPPAPSTQLSPEPQQPVAYDAEGRPLYLQPPTVEVQQPTQQPEQAPQFIHVSRALEPVAPIIPDDIKQKHDQSKKRYPFLNLSDGEYIISAVRRHPIGMIVPAALAVLLVGLTLSVLYNYSAIVAKINLGFPLPTVDQAAFPLIMLAVLFAMLGSIYVYVYRANKFFLTNESVIQEIQTSLFSRNEQTVSLSNIEDASFTQRGVFQQLFSYGSIRLSTEGDETTYRFSFVCDPKKQIATLNNAVEAFKNGRPIDQNEAE